MKNENQPETSSSVSLRAMIIIQTVTIAIFVAIQLAFKHGWL